MLADATSGSKGSSLRGPVLALLLALGVFAVYAWSAFCFIRLPPLGSSTTDLGWLERWAYPQQIIVEPDGENVWLILRGSGPGGTIDACLVESADGRAIHCRSLAEADPEGERWRIHHAWGSGLLLVVLDGIGVPTRWHLLSRDEEVARGALDLDEVTNVFWTPEAGGFEVYGAEVIDGQAWVHRRLIAPDGQMETGEPTLVADGLPSHVDMVVAVLPGPPPGIVYVGRVLTLIRVQDGRTQGIDSTPCAHGVDVCIQASSSARAVGQDWVSTWLDNRGVVVTNPPGIAGYGSRFLVEQLQEDGGSYPVVTFVRGTDRRWLDTTLRSGARLSLRLVERALETVLMGALREGEWRPLARRAGPSIGYWGPIPTRYGLLLLRRPVGANPARLVAVSEQLEVLDPEPRLSRLLSIIGGRFSLDPVATTAYLLLLVGFLPLAALGIRAIRHTPRERARKTVTALLLYAFTGGVLLLMNADYLFPPT